MQGMNKGIIWAFVGAMAGVLVVMGMWQFVLIALTALAGYALFRLKLAERWRMFMRRRRG